MPKRRRSRRRRHIRVSRSLEGGGERPARRYGVTPSRRIPNAQRAARRRGSLRFVGLAALFQLLSERHHPLVDLGSQLGQFGFEPLVGGRGEPLELGS
jgi:hypothetical protein